MMNTLSFLEKELFLFQRRSRDLCKECKTESFATMVNSLKLFTRCSLLQKFLGNSLKLKAYSEPCPTSKMEIHLRCLTGF